MRHRQTKEPGRDRGHLNHRATSRLYRQGHHWGVAEDRAVAIDCKLVERWLTEVFML
jgi:hypothetical protein